MLTIFANIYKATNILFGSYYPTFHSMLGVLLNCSFIFLKFRSINDLEISIDKCLAKWIKYFRNIPYLCVIGTIIDPKLKQ